MQPIHPQTQLVRDSNTIHLKQQIDPVYVLHVLTALQKSIEKLEDHIKEVEYRLNRHVNALDDFAHKI